MRREMYPSGDGGYTDDPSYWRSLIDHSAPPMFGGALPGCNAWRPSPVDVEAQKRYSTSFCRGATTGHVYNLGEWVDELSPCFRLKNAQGSEISFKKYDDESVGVCIGRYNVLMRFPEKTQMSIIEDGYEMKMRLYAAGAYPYSDCITIPFGLEDEGEEIHEIKWRNQPNDSDVDDVFKSLSKAGVDDDDIKDAVKGALDKRWLKNSRESWIAIRETDYYGYKISDEKENRLNGVLTFIRENLWYRYMTIGEMAKVVSSLPEDMMLVNEMGKIKMTNDGKFVSLATEGGIKQDVLNYQLKQKTKYPTVYGKPTDKDRNTDENWGVLIPSDTLVVWTGYRLVLVYYKQPCIYIEAKANILGRDMAFNNIW